jgi:hypothetical protein
MGNASDPAVSLLTDQAAAWGDAFLRIGAFGLAIGASLFVMVACWRALKSFAGDFEGSSGSWGDEYHGDPDGDGNGP